MEESHSPFDPQTASLNNFGEPGQRMQNAHVAVELNIAKPSPEVFAIAADRRQRIKLLPDNFSGVHIMPGPVEGTGARFAFQVETSRGSYRSVTEVIVWEPPISFVEQTDDGESRYETRWRFRHHAEGTAVSMEMHYQSAGSRLLRWLTGRFERHALQQTMLVELYRLKEMVESP